MSAIPRSRAARDGLRWPVRAPRLPRLPPAKRVIAGQGGEHVMPPRPPKNNWRTRGCTRDPALPRRQDKARAAGAPTSFTATPK